MDYGEKLSKEEFVRMIKKESHDALNRIRKMNGNADSEDFRQFAQQFIEQLDRELAMEKIDTQKLIAYIKDLEERERKEILKKNAKHKDEEESKGKKKGRKRGKKKVSKEEELKKYGPYFNYTPFEWAVIATKGKAPFNNEHVELITNIGYDQEKKGYWSPSTHQRGAGWEGFSPASKGIGDFPSPMSRNISSRGTMGQLTSKNNTMKRLVSQDSRPVKNSAH
mmetsp:Transcript_13764/g.9927  ORF Transcript_13764/g.9927 Transcript_13764/m.9927 type:complete len:223 (+) Transcript_13764:1318-1986(+)